MVRLLHTAALTKGNALVFITFFLCSSLFLSSCVQKTVAEKTKPQGNPPVIVDVIVAISRSIQNTVEANGSVVANEYVELHPEISGRITYLNVPEGAYVAKGTVIARINDADLQATLAK